MSNGPLGKSFSEFLCQTKILLLHKMHFQCRMHNNDRFVHWCRFLSRFPSFNKFNTLRPRQNGRHFTYDTFKRIFLNENFGISIKISLKFVPKGPINNIPALVQIMAWRRPGDKPLSESMMVSLLTHICVTRPQWINNFSALSKHRFSIDYLEYHVYIWQVWPRLSCANTGPIWIWFKDANRHLDKNSLIEKLANGNLVTPNWLFNAIRYQCTILTIMYSRVSFPVHDSYLQIYAGPVSDQYDRIFCGSTTIHYTTSSDLIVRCVVPLMLFVLCFSVLCWGMLCCPGMGWGWGLIELRGDHLNIAMSSYQ